MLFRGLCPPSQHSTMHILLLCTLSGLPSAFLNTLSTTPASPLFLVHHTSQPLFGGVWVISPSDAHARLARAYESSPAQQHCVFNFGELVITRPRYRSVLTPVNHAV